MGAPTMYVPGVCNIGKAEISRRSQAGWIGAGITAAAWITFYFAHVQAPWRLFLFVPAALSASGFLQAVMHFCAGFGNRGVFNFGPEVGKTDTVAQAEFRKKDKRKAQQILRLSALIGVVMAVVAYFV